MKKLAALLPLIITLGTTGAQAGGDPAAGKTKSVTCAGCHGSDGNSANPLWPNLAGQHPEYLAVQLKHFKDGDRQNALMSSMAVGLSDQDMADLAAYFANQPLKAGTTPEEHVEAGAKIYRGGNPESGVPACMACHGPAGQGNGPSGYPALQAQHAAYTAKTLQDYASGARGGGQAEVMQAIAASMSPEEIEAVSAYVSGLYQAR